MPEIDYTVIAIIQMINVVVAIVVKETIDILKDWRKRLHDEIIKKRNNNSSDKNSNHKC